MSKEKKLLIDYFPPLRDKAEEETTPDYLNYISDIIDKSHQTLLMEQSPYYKILNIFNIKLFNTSCNRFPLVLNKKVIFSLYSSRPF